MPEECSYQGHASSWVLLSQPEGRSILHVALAAHSGNSATERILLEEEGLQLKGKASQPEPRGLPVDIPLPSGCKGTLASAARGPGCG